jgi:hypothetical protein
MRTKALLTAAALAAGALSTMAQSNVYSLNIVGYVNVSAPIGNFTYANPLDLDGTNSAANVLHLPDGTVFAFWTGNSFDYWYFDSSLGISPDGWYASDGVTPRTAPVLTLGKGFYLNPPAAFTNTYVGNVVPAPGVTNTLSVGLGNFLVSSPLPVGGYVTNVTMDLHLPDGTLVSQWAGNHFNFFYFDSTLGIAADGWYQSDGVTPGAPPQLNLGQSMYVNAPSAWQWKQSLQ